MALGTLGELRQVVRCENGRTGIAVGFPEGPLRRPVENACPARPFAHDVHHIDHELQLAFRRIRPEKVPGHVTTGAGTTGCSSSTSLSAGAGCASTTTSLSAGASTTS